MGRRGEGGASGRGGAVGVWGEGEGTVYIIRKKRHLLDVESGKTIFEKCLKLYVSCSTRLHERASQRHHQTIDVFSRRQRQLAKPTGQGTARVGAVHRT